MVQDKKWYIVWKIGWVAIGLALFGWLPLLPIATFISKPCLAFAHVIPCFYIFLYCDWYTSRDGSRSDVVRFM